MIMVHFIIGLLVIVTSPIWLTLAVLIHLTSLFIKLCISAGEDVLESIEK